MLQSFYRLFIENIRLVDLFDMGLVSLFLYAFITWLRRSASRRAILGVSSFIGVYILARFFEMYMTQALIEALVVLFVIAAIVVFQPDIRRIVDRLGTWRLFQRSASSPAKSIVDILVESAFKMAETRVGALIAIKGIESWDFQIDGGIPLNGAVSQPLLYSIFDTGSIGHDGAVLIEGDRITKFAARLPLSTNQKELGQRGTRHAAALGLSEQCDAALIVVSEERGTVSLAEGGELTEARSPEQLRRRLERFWNRHHVPSSGVWPAWRHRGSLQTAALSLVLASVFWAVFGYRSETVYRTFEVPIELRNLQPNVVMEESPPMSARVTVTGPAPVFRSLDPASLVISLDLSQVEEGKNSLPITRDNLKLPTGLSFYHVEPREAQVKARKYQPRQVPVAVRTAGTLPDSLELVGVTASPERVRLLVPANLARPIRDIPTEPVNLKQITATTHIRTRLVIPSAANLPPNQPPDVTVRVEVRRKPPKRK